MPTPIVASSRLRVSVEPALLPLRRAVRVSIRAVDAQTGSPVPGTVTISTYVAGQRVSAQYPANTPFSATFATLVTRVPSPEGDGADDVLYPEGTVSAAGYPVAAIPFAFGDTAL